MSYNEMSYKEQCEKIILVFNRISTRKLKIEEYKEEIILWEVPSVPTWSLVVYKTNSYRELYEHLNFTRFECKKKGNIYYKERKEVD